MEEKKSRFVAKETRTPPPKMDWSKVAARTPVGGVGVALGAGLGRERERERDVVMSREEREEEELRLVLEMSLTDS